MEAIDCPFQAMEKILQDPSLPPIRIVDFHADATSEKMAMAWHLDGRVSATIGTHTHIPTADERVFPKGMAYMTDIGMVGSFDSVIGAESDKILYRFMYHMPKRHDVAKRNVKICGAVISIDTSTGHATGIKRILVEV